MKRYLILFLVALTTLIALSCGGGSTGDSGTSDSSEDLTNFEVRGKVTDLVDIEQKAVSISLSGNLLGTSDESGTFSIAISEGEHTLTFSKSGYTTVYSQVFIGDSIPDGSEATLLLPTGESTPDGQLVVSATLSVVLKPTQNLSLDDSESVTLSKTGSHIAQDKVFNFDNDRVFTRIKTKAGTSVKRYKYAGASLDFSKIDPTRELDAMPGPLRAIDSTFQQSKARFKGRQNTSEENVGLESVTMMDLTLRDSSGNAIQLSDGDALESFIRLPERDQENYLESYENGERVIPWYSFDPEQNTWVREGEAELVNINNEMYAKADVTHFSWWNLDKPRDRGRLIGQIKDNFDAPIAGIEVVLEAIGTSFRTSTITDQDGNYSFRILRNSKAKVFARRDGTSGEAVILDFDDSPESVPHVQDLTYQLILVSGRVINNIGTTLQNALIKLPSGQGVYSDSNGNYQFKTGLGSEFDIFTQYTENDLNFISKTSFTSDNLQADTVQDIVIDTENFIQVSGQVRLDDVGIPNASVYTLNGERTVADADGVYSFQVSNSAGISLDESEISIRAFYFDESTNSFPELSFDIQVEEGATEIVQNFSFSQASQVELIGRVLVDGVATKGVEIFCDNGCLTTTDSDGLYRFDGYAGQTITLYAITSDRSNQDIRLEQEFTLFETESNTNQADNFEFVLPKATVHGNVSIDLGSGQLQGLGGVTIISESGIQRQSATDGSYQFTIAPEVDTTLWFEVDTPSGLVSIEQNITALDIDEELSLNVNFDRSQILNLSPILESVELSSFKVEINDNIQISVTATDPDGEGELLSFSAITENSNLANVAALGDASVSGNSNTQVFTFSAGSTPGWVETELEISDGENIITRSVFIEIVTTIINNPPSLLGLQAPTQVQSNGKYEISYLVHDPEGDNLDYEFTVSPSDGISIENATRTVTSISGLEKDEIAENRKVLILDNATIGTIYTLSANVSDGSQSLLTTQSISVIDEAPIFNSFSPDVNNFPYSDTDISFNVSAEDPEGQELSYIWYFKDSNNGTFDVVSTSSNYLFNPARVLASGQSAQRVTFLVQVSDGTNTTEKQKSIVILPESAGVRKSPVSLSVFWNSPSVIDISERISYTATLTYNTGEQEDVTANVKTSGFSPNALGTSLGAFTALDDGEYIIDFSYNSNGVSYKESLSLTVNSPFLSSLIASITRATIVIGDTVQVMLTAIFSDNEERDVTEDSNSQYFSSEPGIASFSDEKPGELSANNAGKTTLNFSYTDPNDQSVAQTSKEVEVLPVLLDQFHVTPVQLSMVVGQSQVLSGNAIFNNGYSKLVSNFKSTSDNPDIAIVNEDNIVFPTGEGNTRFLHTYIENGVEKQSITTITVSLPSPEIIDLKVVPEDTEINLNKTQAFKVFAIYNTGHIEELGDTNMTMSANLGEYDQGTFRALEIGMATLTFEYENLEVTSEISIVMEPDEATLTQITKIGGAAYKVDSLTRNIGGQNQNLMVYGDYQTLSSVLVNNPDEPIILDELSLNYGYIADFQLTENYLHVATGYHGYSMVTYDNPSQLEIPNGYSYTIDGWSYKVFTQKVGNARYAYLLSQKGWSSSGRTGIDGVVILDITNPRNITPVGKVKIDGYPIDMAYSNGKLYVAQDLSWQFNFLNSSWNTTGIRGVSVIDVSNPNLASLIESYASSSAPTSLVIQGENIIVGERNKLSTYSLNEIYSNPLQSVTLQGTIREINPDSKGYIVSLGWGGVARVSNDLELIYQDSPPIPDFQPTFTTLDPEANEDDEQPSSSTRAQVYSATALNDVLYLANGFNGLGILEEENDGLGEAKKGFPNLGYTSEIQVSGNLLFAASWEKGIIVLNTEDPINPTKMGEYLENGYYISKIHWDSEGETLFAHLYSLRSFWWWCYYGGSLGFEPHKVIALKWQDNQLQLVDTKTTEGWVNEIDYSNGNLYMAANDFGVYQWGHDAEIQSISWDGEKFGETINRVAFDDNDSFTYLRTITAQGNLIVAGSYYGSYFYDENLVQLSSLTRTNSSFYRYPNSYSFFHNGDLLISSSGRLNYINLKDPTKPELKSTVFTGWGRALDSYKNVALTASYWGGIKLISYKDPSNPVSVPYSEFTSPDYLEHLQWEGDKIFMGSGWNGIYIIEPKIPEQYTNFNPVAVLPDQLIGSTNSPVTLDASASYDSENDPLTYSWSLISPEDNSLLSNTDQIQTDLSFPGGESSVTVELTVSDPYGSSSQQVQIISNTAPVAFAGNQFRFVSGSEILLEGYANDAEENISSFLWTQIYGDNVTLVNANTQIASFTDTTSSNSYIFEFSVSDSYETSTDNVTLIRNKAPSVSIDGLTTTGFGVDVTYSTNVNTDADGDLLTFSWSLESDVEIETTASENTLTFTTPNAIGNIFINVVANDGYEDYETTYTLYVTGDNFPPEVDPLEDILITRNENVLIPAYASDLNNDELYYLWEANSNDNLISFSDNMSSTANLSSIDLSGNVEIALSVSDNAVTVVETFLLTINEPPEINITGEETVLYSEVITLYANVTDPENVNLDVTWEQTSGSNIEWVQNGSSIQVTPPSDNVILGFKASTSDNFYSQSESFSVNVIYNNSPVISSISGNSMITSSQEVTLSVSSSDIDGDTLAYQWVQLSGANVTLTGNTSANIMFTPTEGGTYTFEVELSDEYHTITEQVSIFYNADAPVIVSDNVFRYTTTLEFDLDASQSYDPEEKPISFLWEQLSGNNIDITNSTSDSPNIFSLQPSGNYEILLTVDDGHFSSNQIILIEQASTPTQLLHLDIGDNKLNSIGYYQSGENLIHYYLDTTDDLIYKRNISIADGTYSNNAILVQDDNNVLRNSLEYTEASIKRLEGTEDRYIFHYNFSVFDDSHAIKIIDGLDSGNIQQIWDSSISDHSNFTQAFGNVFYSQANVVYKLELNTSANTEVFHTSSNGTIELSEDNGRLYFFTFSGNRVSNFSIGNENQALIGISNYSSISDATHIEGISKNGVQYMVSTNNSQFSLTINSSLTAIFEGTFEIYDSSTFVEFNEFTTEDVRLHANDDFLVLTFLSNIGTIFTKDFIIPLDVPQIISGAYTPIITEGENFFDFHPFDFLNPFIFSELILIDSFELDGEQYLLYDQFSGIDNFMENNFSRFESSLLYKYDQSGNSVIFETENNNAQPFIDSYYESAQTNSSVFIDLQMTSSSIDPISGDYSNDGKYGIIKVEQIEGELVDVLNFHSDDLNPIEFTAPSTPQTLVFRIVALSHGIAYENELIVEVTE